MNLVSSEYLFSLCFCGLFLWASSFFYRVSPNIFCRAGLVVTYSFSFCHLGSSLSLLLFWMRALLDRVFLAACSSHLGPWIYPASPFWPARSLWEGSAVNLILLPIYIRDLLSLAALRIFSLSLWFASFTIKCWGVERVLLILGGFSLSPGSECLFPFPR